MKWQDTTPHWRAQPISDLRARALQRWPDLLGSPNLERLLAPSPVRPEQPDPADGPRPGAADDAATPWLLFEQAAISTVIAHLGDARHEQGGLLLGHAYGAADYCIATAADGKHDDITLPDEPSIAAICVTEALPSVDFDSSAVSLRMQSRLWDQARARLDDSAASGLLVIGWYHSHPDLGAFFSSSDERTQAAFFAHAYSVGWVIDPIRREHACFLGKASTPVDSERILLQR